MLDIITYMRIIKTIYSISYAVPLSNVNLSNINNESSTVIRSCFRTFPIRIRKRPAPSDWNRPHLITLIMYSVYCIRMSDARPFA